MVELEVDGDPSSLSGIISVSVIIDPYPRTPIFEDLSLYLN